jgi:hypothetical protein
MVLIVFCADFGWQAISFQPRCQMYCETNPDCSFFTYYEESKDVLDTSQTQYIAKQLFLNHAESCRIYL